MLYGWMGCDLEIDLSTGKIEKTPTAPQARETYIGGKGSNARILWDRVPPEVDAFSADNLLIIGTGALSGSLVPGANKACITFKSPLTGLQGWSSLGGSFAPELKCAGYDTIVVSGKSPTPVYIWVNDDQVEIRDASHLWGKSTHEAQRLIQEELKEDKAQVMAIGLAGENKVLYSSIEHSTGASASRGGVGAIMGDKKLKAIAVRGTKDIAIAKPGRLVELCEQVMGRTEKAREDLFETYTSEFNPLEMKLGAYGHWDEPVTLEVRDKMAEVIREMDPKFERESKLREVACFNCGFRCKHEYPTPRGGYSFIKCGSWALPMMATKLLDIHFNMEFYSLCEEYGLDTISASNCIGFAISLYQKGILTRKDTDGMDLVWGKAEVALSLLEKIVRREGIGDVLADGVYAAAQKIGRGAEDYAVTIKKQDPMMYEVRGHRYALTLAITDRSDTTRLVSLMVGLWNKSKEAREAYLKSGFFPYPKEFEKYFLAERDLTDEDFEGVLQFASYDEETYNICDLTGICYFWVGWHLYAPISSRSLLAELTSCVTGMDIDEAGLTQAARRAGSLVRAYNVREGIRRKDDTVPKRLINRAPYLQYRKIELDLLDRWLDRWYQLKGWNSDGIPTGEALAELGLSDIGRELEQRGMLTG